MADFLGSYYDSGEVDGIDLDEKVFSQRMAVLNAEQPVSVLEMDNIDSNKIPMRLRNLEALGQKDSILSQDDRRSSDEDFEIPVASMSAFDKEKPSMVSVQLQTLKKSDLIQEQCRARIQTIRTQRAEPCKVNENLFSPTSTQDLENTSASAVFSSRAKTLQKREAVPNELWKDEDVQNVQQNQEAGKRGANVKASLLKLFGRKKESRGRKK